VEGKTHGVFKVLPIHLEELNKTMSMVCSYIHLDITQAQVKLQYLQHQFCTYTSVLIIGSCIFRHPTKMKASC